MLVKRALGATASEVLETEALAFFLKFYRTHALAHTKLYVGVQDALDDALSLGHRMAVLTNKPVNISRDMIGSLGLSDHFFRIYGGDSFQLKKPDRTGIDKLREEAHESAHETLMIGDSGVDIQTARNAGVRSCGVLWGFQPQAFTADPPDYRVQTPEEMQALWQPIGNCAQPFTQG